MTFTRPFEGPIVALGAPDTGGPKPPPRNTPARACVPRPHTCTNTEDATRMNVYGVVRGCRTNVAWAKGHLSLEMESHLFLSGGPQIFCLFASQPSIVTHLIGSFDSPAGCMRPARITLCSAVRKGSRHPSVFLHGQISVPSRDTTRLASRATSAPIPCPSPTEGKGPGQSAAVVNPLKHTRDPACPCVPGRLVGADIQPVGVVPLVVPADHQQPPHIATDELVCSVGHSSRPNPPRPGTP